MAWSAVEALALPVGYTLDNARAPWLGVQPGPGWRYRQALGADGEHAVDGAARARRRLGVDLHRRGEVAQGVAQPAQGDLLHVAADGPLVGRQQRLVGRLLAQA